MAGGAALLATVVLAGAAVAAGASRSGTVTLTAVQSTDNGAQLACVISNFVNASASR